MTSTMRQLEVEVSCPDCLLSFVIPLDVIEESQRLLDERGYCTGPASFECPAPYFAALVPPDAIAHAKATTIGALDAEVSRWENEGGAPKGST
jgi:hypothetical protein